MKIMEQIHANPNALPFGHQEMKINTDYLARTFHFDHEPEILGGYIKLKMKLCFL